MGALECDDDGRRNDGHSDHDDRQIAKRQDKRLRGWIEHPVKQRNQHPGNRESRGSAEDQARDRD